MSLSHFKLNKKNSKAISLKLFNASYLKPHLLVVISVAASLSLLFSLKLHVSHKGAKI